MQEVLKALNRLVEDHVVENYAIGGAIAASFHIEAVQTEDVDAFVFLPQASGGVLSLTLLYHALQTFGGVVEGAHVRFGEWRCKFLLTQMPW